MSGVRDAVLTLASAVADPGMAKFPFTPLTDQFRQDEGCLSASDMLEGLCRLSGTDGCFVYGSLCEPLVGLPANKGCGPAMANTPEKLRNVSITHGTTDQRVVAKALQVGWTLFGTFASDLGSAHGSETTHYVLKWEGDTLPVTVDGM